MSRKKKIVLCAVLGLVILLAAGGRCSPRGRIVRIGRIAER